MDFCILLYIHPYITIYNIIIKVFIHINDLLIKEDVSFYMHYLYTALNKMKIITFLGNIYIIE